VLTADERMALGAADITNDIGIQVRTYQERKQTFAQISFVPLRKNPSNGQIEKLVAFKLVIQEVRNIATRAANPSGFISTSQLAGGEWFKVAVTQDGIYKVT